MFLLLDLSQDPPNQTVVNRYASAPTRGSYSAALVVIEDDQPIGARLTPEGEWLAPLPAVARPPDPDWDGFVSQFLLPGNLLYDSP